MINGFITPKTQLPDKASALIRLALADLRKVEADPTYDVNMGAWHEPRVRESGAVCSVCMAGAVIAGTLGIDPRLDVFPADFDIETEEKLIAMDRLRGGEIASACETVGWPIVNISQSLKDKLSDLSYTDAKTAGILSVWYDNFEQLARVFEDAGN